jgi:type I restriction enzyme S subunit
MVDLITDHIDIWTTAQVQKANGGRGRGKKSNGQSPHGFKKLRELILELAVRGKLVPQDPNDEPASVLLEKIAREKARLIKEGKIKKQKKLPEISDDEKPFELPEGWKFSRFGNTTFNRDAERIPLSVGERKGRHGEYDYYGASGVIDSIDEYLFDKPLLLIGEDGANLINRSTPIAFMARGKYWVNNHAHVIDGISEGLLLYICLHINAISLEPYVTGTAQPKMNQAKMNSIVLAIPPLAEQHRIVAKVDELMALCDRLEQQQTDSNATHQTLLETLLATLTTADQGEFAKAWQRIEDHFDTLFTTEQSIDQLKQTILQLAVMGKLVPQNPDDEPASVLLERIAREKARLIKEGKIKKQKKLPEISDDEKPFELPDGWEWSNLSDLFALVTDGDHQAPPKSDSGVPFLVIGNLNRGKIVFDDCKYVPEEYYQNLDWGRQPVAGDILYTVTGSYGIPIPVDSDESFCVQRHVAILKSTKSTPRKYLKLVLGSKYALDHATKIATGIAQKTVPLTGLRKMPVPVPSENEQHRIVAKVDELMALCDTLKTRLTEAQTTQVQLADTIVEQAVA